MEQRVEWRETTDDDDDGERQNLLNGKIIAITRRDSQPDSDLWNSLFARGRRRFLHLLHYIRKCRLL